MTWVLAVLALALYAADEWVAIRRQRAVTNGTRLQRVLWCAVYGAAIGVGIVLVIESRWNALLIPLGAALGAWPEPRDQS